MKMRDGFLARKTMAPDGVDGGGAPSSTGTTDQGAGGPQAEDQARLDSLADWMSFDPIKTPNEALPPIQGGDGGQGAGDGGQAQPGAEQPKDAKTGGEAAPKDGELTEEQLRAAMPGLLFGGSEPKPVQAAQPDPAPMPAASAQPAADAPWQAFTAEQMAIPPQIEQAIFDPDVDPNVRSQAFRMLLAVHANAAASAAVERMQQHVLPTALQQHAAATAAQSTAQQFHDKFYGTHPELKAVPELVKRAIGVVQQQDAMTGRKTQLDEPTLARVAQLAKYALANLSGMQPAPAPANPNPAPSNPGNAYVAGGARPEGHGGLGGDQVNPHMKEMLDLIQF